MIKVRTLENGIRIVMEHMDNVATVAFGIFVKTGSINETPELHGASHFVEHMMFKGTEKRTAKDIADQFDMLGGSVNAYTSREHTCYYFKTTGDTFRPAAEILCDMMTNSLFDEVEIEKERQVILEEIKMLEDQPDELSMEHCTRLVFSGDVLEHDVAGDPQALAGQTGGILKDYIKRQYTCDSIVVAVAGRFNEEEVENIVQERLSIFEPVKDHSISPLLPYNPGTITVCKDIEQTNLCLGTRFMTMDDQNYYAGAFFNNILGGSMSSRLFQNIREEKGLAYTVVSMSQAMIRSGMLYIYAGIAHDKVDQCVSAILDEFEDLSRNGATERELEKAKNQGKSNVVFSMERTHSRMLNIGRNLLMMDKVYEQEEILDMMNKVTLDDVNETARAFADISSYSCAVVAPRNFDFAKHLR